MFAPLHVKSDYSLGFGTASVHELTARAAELGHGVLGLADLENLSGQVQFHAECRARGVRPLTGVELRPGFRRGRRPGERQGRLVLLAVDLTGYANLCRIVSLRCGGRPLRRGPICANELLAVLAGLSDGTSGLFALSDDAGLLAEITAQGLLDRSRLGLLVIRPAGSDSIIFRQGAARELGVPLVADLDAVFLQPKDHELHLLQLAIHRGCKVSELTGDPAVENPERLLRSPDEAASLFADLPEALAAAADIAAACRLDLSGAALFPAGLPTEPRVGEKLREHCEAVLADRPAATWSPAHGRRLAEELALLERLGFAGLLLIVAEILAFCRRSRIMVVARGSAVSSLTLHLLGGSPVDPLAEGLLFERFLHPGKKAWPDVDLDLPWHRRDEVIKWVYRRFGHLRVAMVAAHHTFQHRSALREGLKALNIAPTLIAALSAALPKEDLAVEDVDFLGLSGDEIKGAKPAETAPASLASDLSRILPLVQRLIGRPRHIATHPGGIVIADSPLDQILPLERAAKGLVITQYDLAAVAALGLVKIDLLGNRCLSELEETLHLAGSNRGIEDVPVEDSATLSLIDRAETLGCFQLESPAMRSLLARLPVRKRQDLTAALALIRPGPASGAAKEAFIRRARGEEAAEIVEPAIADRLAETYGLLLYEEDIMMLLSRVGGIELTEADKLRAAIVDSGGDNEILARLEQEFLAKANRPGMSNGTLSEARKAWAAAARFAAYTFNKAHAASYARLAYLAAYMKTHHPAQFACALLNHHQGIYPLRTLAAEFQRRGIVLLPPHVNLSEYTATLAGAADQTIRLGLGQVKGLAVRTAGEILTERVAHGPFATLPELVARVGLSSRDRRSLVLCGACDGLAPLDPEGYPFIHQLVLEKFKEGVPPRDLLHLQPPPVRRQGERLRLFQAFSRIQNELALLDMHLTAHPLTLLRPEAARYHCLTIGDAVTLPTGVRVRLIALVAAMRRVRTGKGILQFLSLEDETGLLEAAVLPQLYARLGNRVATPGPFLVDGRLLRRHGAVHLEVTVLTPFHERPRPYDRRDR